HCSRCSPSWPTLTRSRCWGITDAYGYRPDKPVGRGMARLVEKSIHPTHPYYFRAGRPLPSSLGMNPSPQNPPNDQAQAAALARFGLISKIQELLQQPVPLRLALERAAACPLTNPDGSTGLVAVRTLEDWWYAYQHGGFAALHPKGRCDRGVPRL